MLVHGRQIVLCQCHIWFHDTQVQLLCIFFFLTQKMSSMGFPSQGNFYRPIFQILCRRTAYSRIITKLCFLLRAINNAFMLLTRALTAQYLQLMVILDLQRASMGKTCVMPKMFYLKKNKCPRIAYLCYCHLLITKNILCSFNSQPKIIYSPKQTEIEYAQRNKLIFYRFTNLI